MELNDQQLMRYSRQLFLPEIDISGQTKLLGSDIVIIGAGGLGAISAPLLCAAGVGRITIIDDDHVELSNLPRQIAYTETDIGLSKAACLKKRLLALNSQCVIETLDRRLVGKELESLIRSKHLVLDGTDNFASRYTHNKACFNTKTPLLSAAVSQFSGQLTIFNYAPNSPCYECLYPNTSGEENSCAENGVLGSTSSLVASMQALEATKYLSGMQSSLVGQLLSIDMKNLKWHSAKIQVDKACQVCQ